MRTIIFLILIFSSSCDKRVKLTKTRGLVNISEIKSSIGDVYIVPWKVGENHEDEISMGFIMKIDVPQFSKEDQAILSETYPIDSWAYRVIHTAHGRKREVGNLYLPFKRTIKTTDNFSVRMYYHSAAVSQRFRKFLCPAFGHRKKITDFKIEETEPEDSFFVRPNGNLKIKNFALDHIPVTFSLGTNLTGEYEVEIALYSTLENKRYSEYIKMGNKIIIGNEAEIKVSSCTGIREETYPLPTSREPRIEDVEIR